MDIHYNINSVEHLEHFILLIFVVPGPSGYSARSVKAYFTHPNKTNLVIFNLKILSTFPPFL